MESRLHGLGRSGPHLDDSPGVLSVGVDEFEAFLGIHHIVDIGYHTFGDQPAQRELNVVSRRAHRGGNGNAVHLDLEGFFNRESIRAGGGRAITPPQHAAPVGRGHGFPPQAVTSA